MSKEIKIGDQIEFVNVIGDSLKARVLDPVAKTDTPTIYVRGNDGQCWYVELGQITNHISRD